MLADWSVECAPEDPVLVVPWSSDDTSDTSSGRPNHTTPGTHFVDLREDPYALDQVPEAEQHPPLMQALRALNAPRSPVFTAKCDAWHLAPDELADLYHQLDLPHACPGDAASGFASYIDLIWRDRSIFASFHQSEQLLHRLARLAAPFDQPMAMLDCVVRPALIDLTGPQEGFSITFYVKAIGPDPHTAREIWAAALESVVALLRSKDIALA